MFLPFFNKLGSLTFVSQAQRPHASTPETRGYDSIWLKSEPLSKQADPPGRLDPGNVKFVSGFADIGIPGRGKSFHFTLNAWYQDIP